jgi:hypothetical protein
MKQLNLSLNAIHLGGDVASLAAGAVSRISDLPCLWEREGDFPFIL